MKKENIKKIIFVFLVVSLIHGSVVLAQELPSLPSGEEIPTDDPVVELEPGVPADPLQESTAQPISISIKDEGNILEVVNIPLASEGTISINDSDGGVHEVSSRSVLALLYFLDQTTGDFKVGELVYYPSFNALYLKCMSLKGKVKCDNWLYEVNGEGPSVGMDNFLLQGGENVEIYYSSFWNDPGAGEEVVAEPAVERSSGGRRHRKTKVTKVEEIKSGDTIPEISSVKTPVVAYLAFPEFYTPQEIAQTKPEVAVTIPSGEVAAKLVATAGESDSPVGKVVFISATFLILVFLTYKFMLRG